MTNEVGSVHCEEELSCRGADYTSASRCLEASSPEGVRFTPLGIVVEGVNSVGDRFYSLDNVSHLFAQGEPLYPFSYQSRTVSAS